MIGSSYYAEITANNSWTGHKTSPTSFDQATKHIDNPMIHLLNLIFVAHIITSKVTLNLLLLLSAKYVTKNLWHQSRSLNFDAFQ